MPATRQRQPEPANIPAVDPRTSCVVSGPRERVSVQMFGRPSASLEEAVETDDSSSEVSEDPFEMDDDQLASQLHGLVSEAAVAAPAAVLVSRAAVAAPAAVLVSEAAVVVLATTTKAGPARVPIDLPLSTKAKLPAPVGYPRKVVAWTPKANFSSASSSSVVALPAKPSSSSASPPVPPAASFSSASSSSSSRAPPVLPPSALPRNLESCASPVPQLATFPRNPLSCMPPVPPAAKTSSSSLHFDVGRPKPPPPPPPAKSSYGGKGYGTGLYGGKGYGPGLYGGQGPQGGHHQSGGTHREYYKQYYKAKGQGKLAEFIAEWGTPPTQGGQAFHQRWAGPYA